MGYVNFLFGTFAYQRQGNTVLIEMAGCQNSRAVSENHCSQPFLERADLRELLLGNYHQILPPKCFPASIAEPWFYHTFKHYASCCEQEERAATGNEVMLFIALFFGFKMLLSKT